MKRLLLNATGQRETAYTEGMQLVQEVLQQRWPAMIDSLLSSIGVQLKDLPSQIVDQLTKEVQEKREPH